MVSRKFPPSNSPGKLPLVNYHLPKSPPGKLPLSELSPVSGLGFRVGEFDQVGIHQGGWIGPGGNGGNLQGELTRGGGIFLVPSFNPIFIPFLRIHVFLCPGFSGSKIFRVWVQVLEVSPKVDHHYNFHF